MMVALGYCHKDFLGAEKLFRWMTELDGQQQAHKLLLITSNGTEKKHISVVIKAAHAAFQNVISIMPITPDERGWPISSNHLWLSAYFHIKRMGAEPFFWIEPDCVPLKAGWLDLFQTEYAGCGKPFMGCIYESPWPHLTGCAIYPPDIEKLSPNILKPGERAWDMVDTERTLPQTHHTNLFHHIWGNFKYNIAASFPSQRSMKLIREQAVLFHRCKDGSLIDRLRERRDHQELCRLLSNFGNPSNGFQDFEDSHATEAIAA